MPTHPTPTSPTPAPNARRRLVGLALVLASLATLATLASSATPASATVCNPGATLVFSDIGEAHPWCREIHGAEDVGFVNGYADGTYRPTNVVTRQAAAAILWRIANEGSLVVPAPCVAAPFPDVPTDHPFCPEIRDAALAGVFTGYGDGTFKPSAPMTRLAMAMVLARFPNGPVLLEACGAAPFADIPQDHPQCAQINYAKKSGILNGYPDGTYRPGNGMTRQAFAAVALRTWNHITP